MRKNKITLQPKDYIQMAYGLRIENKGDKVIELELPYSVKIYPVEHFNIIDVKLQEKQSQKEHKAEER